MLCILNMRNYCQCGCGQKVAKKRPYRKAPKFVHGHNNKRKRRYKKKDCGYKTRCYIWLLAKDKDSYGVSWEAGKSIRAHVQAWIKKHGPVPKGKQLDHLCKTRACIRISHLEPVTSKVNTRRGKGVLTREAVANIKKLYGPSTYNGRGRSHTDISMQELATKFGVGITTIHNAIHGVYDEWESKDYVQ